jgi:hypothetical protein
MSDLSTAAWRRSSECAGGSCVEVSILDDQVAVRDSKDANRQVLLFTAPEWHAFLAGVRKGEFDLGQP